MRAATLWMAFAPRARAQRNSLPNKNTPVDKERADVASLPIVDFDRELVRADVSAGGLVGERVAVCAGDPVPCSLNHAVAENLRRSLRSVEALARLVARHAH